MPPQEVNQRPKIRTLLIQGRLVERLLRCQFPDANRALNGSCLSLEVGLWRRAPRQCEMHPGRGSDVLEGVRAVK